MNALILIIAIVIIEMVTGKSLGVLLAPLVQSLIALIKQVLSTLPL